MGKLKTTIVAGLFLLLAFGQAFADRTEEVLEVVETEGADQLEIEIDFGAGKLDIVSADMEEAAKLEIFYSPRYVSYDIDYSTRGNTGRLFLESDLRRHSDMDDIDNDWELTLSRRYPVSLEMDIGASESIIDLGGIPLTRLVMDVGATSGVIDFSEPNPERLRDFDLDIGASSVEITGLANANFERMDISSGAASCELDFRGDFKGESEVDLEVGVGSVDIIIPRGLAVRIEGDENWFSSFDFHGLDIDQIDDDLWESPGFDRAEDRLTIMIDVSMGSVDIYEKR
ncbi:MAG: hypothetical protein GY867_09725 [bacterium]|nr:hypothetical protein [bacterium]